MREKVIFLIDIQSFYASVEKAENPSLKDKPVIVAGDPKARNGIVLAACPIAKSYGIETAEFVSAARRKCPHVQIVRPRMQRYIDVSLEINRIFEEFTDLVEWFSIDECFLDVTASQRLFGDAFAIAKKIQTRVMEATGVYARIGIGNNKIRAKLACDNFAKKNENGIFLLDEKTLPLLWQLPVKKMFGVGSRIEKKLHQMGIFTIGALAQTPLATLRRKWGINGEVLWQTANGIDPSPVSPFTHDRQKGIGHHITLPRDYDKLEDIRVVLLELSTEVARRCRQYGYVGSTVTCGARGADFDNPTGFSRQMTLISPTNYDLDIFHAAYRLFVEHWDAEPVRSIGVSLTNLETSTYRQLSLLEDVFVKERINRALDHIWDKYGRTAIFRASSLTKAGVARDRAKRIGGHYK